MSQPRNDNGPISSLLVHLRRFTRTVASVYSETEIFYNYYISSYKICKSNKINLYEDFLMHHIHIILRNIQNLTTEIQTYHKKIKVVLGGAELTKSKDLIQTRNNFEL